MDGWMDEKGRRGEGIAGVEGRRGKGMRREGKEWAPLCGSSLRPLYQHR